MPAIETDRSRKIRIPRVVYAISATVFVLGTSEFGIAGLLPEIADDMDVSIPRAGLLISGYALAMVIGAPLLTVLTLRLPRRATAVGALGLFIAGQVVAAVAGDYVLLMAARMVTAAATGAFWAVAAAVVVSVVDPAHRARALALQMGGLTVANLLGVPLGSVIGQQFGWRVTMWTIAAGAVVMTGVLLRVLTPTEQPQAPVSVQTEYDAFRNGRLWLALGTIAVFHAAVIAYFGYLAPVITDVADLSEGMVPTALVLFGLGSLVGVQIGGRLADARPWYTLYLGLGTILIALGVVIVAGGVAAVTLAATFATGVAAFTGAASLNGRIFGLGASAPRLVGAAGASAFNIGATLGPWLGGLVISAGWGYRSPAALGIGLVVAAIAMGVLSQRLDARAATSYRSESSAVAYAEATAR